MVSSYKKRIIAQKKAKNNRAAKKAFT